MLSALAKYVINRLIHGLFHIALVISPRLISPIGLKPSWPISRSRADNKVNMKKAMYQSINSVCNLSSINKLKNHVSPNHTYPEIISPTQKDCIDKSVANLFFNRVFRRKNPVIKMVMYGGRAGGCQPFPSDNLKRSQILICCFFFIIKWRSSSILAIFTFTVWELRPLNDGKIALCPDIWKTRFCCHFWQLHFLLSLCYPLYSFH